jgi:hypothetical protein
MESSSLVRGQAQPAIHRRRCGVERTGGVRYEKLLSVRIPHPLPAQEDESYGGLIRFGHSAIVRLDVESSDTPHEPPNTAPRQLFTSFSES